MTEINKENKEGIHLISVKGEIDAGSSILLDNAFKEAIENKEKRIATDLSGLEYISSAGLGVFISHLEEFSTNNAKLVLFGINESVKQVFEILGLEKLLLIVETEKDAINVFNE
ncbi:MAG: STAS domain-containing protein [Ekhidna sp.]|nr:STAS domain-containing protein [Ekhidna sp.]MBC6410679.1 STAS domain-containing protein [Ekhidna sp.]MBC6426118.1 STAS domain-containing protein [Ekhidna sp.]